MRLPLRSQLLLVGFLTLLVYYPVVFAGYSPVDDLKTINWGLNRASFSLKDIFFPGDSYYYRPLIIMSFVADQLLWDMAASFMHLENILIHLCNSLLVFFVCRCLCNTINKEPGSFPLLAALLFALHPINTESVSWLSGRTDVFATFFVLISLWLIIISVKKNNLFFMIGAVVAFFLGCLAKETALFFYVGAIALIFAMQNKNRPPAFLHSVLKFLPAWILWSGGAAGYLVFRNIALSKWDSGVQHVVKAVSGSEAATAISFDYLDQLRIALKVMGFYLKKIIVPWPLNFAIINVSDSYVLLGCALVLIIIGLVYRVVMRGGLVSALFLASIGLTSSALLVALGKMAWTPIAERYLYMPSATFCIGLSVCFCLFLNPTKKSQKLANYAIFSILLMFGGLTMHRSVVWSDPVTFLEDTIEKSPKFIPVYSDLATLYYARGENDKADKLFSWAADQVGDREFSAVDVNRAHLKASEGHLDEAREILLRRLENPGKNFRVVAEALIVVNLDLIETEGDESTIESLKKENVSLLEKMIKSSPHAFLNYRLGKAYLALGNLKKAYENFDYAYKNAPDDSHYKEPARILAEKTRGQ